MKKVLKRVLIMAGGTGGHVFPGLALATYLRDKGIEVHWLGTQAGLESRLVADARFPLHIIQVRGVRGKGMKSLLMAPAMIFTAIFQARRLIKEIDPDVIVGMGGFVSGPGGIASSFLRYPLVIHEQNAKPGLTNKILQYFAKKTLEGFPQAFKTRSTFKIQPNVVTVGNPVRVEIENIPAPGVRIRENQNENRKTFRLLILGGSLGAHVLNDMVPRALLKLVPERRPEVMHQTGEKHFEATKKIYESMNIQGNLTPFIQDIAKAYLWADLVLCRAGALTVTELCAAGLGAIFVPYPFASDDHQTANANFMVSRGAAICIQQHELTESRLADIVAEFSESPQKRLEMAQAAYQLRCTGVVEKIFHI